MHNLTGPGKLLEELVMTQLLSPFMPCTSTFTTVWTQNLRLFSSLMPLGFRSCASTNFPRMIYTFVIFRWDDDISSQNHSQGWQVNHPFCWSVQEPWQRCLPAHFVLSVDFTPKISSTDWRGRCEGISRDVLIWSVTQILLVMDKENADPLFDFALNLILLLCYL